MCNGEKTHETVKESLRVEFFMGNSALRIADAILRVLKSLTKPRSTYN